MSITLSIFLAASGMVQFSGAILPGEESEISECVATGRAEVICECAAPRIVERVNRFNISQLQDIRDEEFAACVEAAADLKPVKAKAVIIP